jgi:hypothetical protein
MIHDSPAINTRLGATAIDLPILQYRRLSGPTRVYEPSRKSLRLGIG